MAFTGGSPTGGPASWGADRRPSLRANQKSVVPVGSWVLLRSAVGVFVLLGSVPVCAAWIGLAATATLALGSMAGMLSAVALMIQDRPSPRSSGWSAAPHAAGHPAGAHPGAGRALFGRAGSIHDVDRGAAPDLGRRHPADHGRGVRRLVAPASRARSGRRPASPADAADRGRGRRDPRRYWTVRGLQAIADTTCGEHSALFSAGASGGSVGLTVARFSGTPD